MGKSKKGLSDIVRSKRNSKAKSSAVNPFEVQINRVKHVVVNKRVEKWEKGRPGVSRSKAIQKRKDTILNEIKQIKKTNVFSDKRIGEKDSTLTAEEKMAKRYALERKTHSDKHNIFNLNEDEVELTHYGQSLAENLKDRPGSDSEDDDLYANKGNTGKFQFGGFSANGDEASWKEKMQEVIIDSKKQKYERQMEREKTVETTKELDDVWKAVKSKMDPQTNEGPNKSTSAFVMLSRSLILERTSGQATDKLKTEEEAAREASERLKKLEAQRLERMRGYTEKISNHVSADSLSSGFACDKKGRMKVSFADSDESDDEDEDGKEEDEDTGDKDDHEEQDEEDGNESDEDDDEEDSENDDSSSDEDNYSDLDNDDDAEDDEEEEENGINDRNTSQNKTKSILKKSKAAPMTSDEKFAETELPYVFEAPETYEELQNLLHGHSPSDQITIISRLRKCYHISLASENKDKLQKINLLLLQYIGDLAKGKDALDGKLVDGLFSHIWDLTQTFSRSTAKFLQSIILERQKEYAALAERRGGRGLFPSLDTLLYLRLVEILFPASDFVHEVTTPSIHFITQMLAESSVRSLNDVTCGIYLSSLCLQFVHSSQRYVPEITTFLHGVLYLASTEPSADSSHIFQPFRKACRESCQLEIKEKCDKMSSSPLSLSAQIHSSQEQNCSSQLRCDLINTCIDLLDECVTVWSELPCLSLVLKPVHMQLQCLPIRFYPKALKDKVAKLMTRIADASRIKFTAMQLQSKKPEPLKLFEPLIEENWSGKRKRGGPDRDAANRKRMVHVYKRDMRSAVREIRRDHAVIAKHKLDITMQKDAERKRKVKEIMSGLASQEGDYNALKKQKKSMKF